MPTYLPTCLLYLVSTTHPPLVSKHYVREVNLIAINIDMEKDAYLPTCLLYLVSTTHPPLDSKHYVREVSLIAINTDMEKDAYLPTYLPALLGVNNTSSTCQQALCT